LPCQDGRDVDLFAVHANASAASDQNLLVVEGIIDIGQAVIVDLPGKNGEPFLSYAAIASN
jgi:hypothetical protein